MVTLPYGLYMAETEKLLNQRENKIKKIIQKVKNYPREEISNLEFYAICENCGIKAGSLTNSEIRHIEQAIKRQTLKI